MTVTSEQSTIQYDSSQVSTGVPLAFPFAIYDPQDITIMVNGLTAIYNLHYNVSVASDSSSATVTPLAAMLTLIGAYVGPITIAREPDFLQPISFSANQALPERVVEQGFDESVMRDQVLARRVANIGQPNQAALTFAQTYYGALNTDPLVRPLDGSAVQNGDRYFNVPLSRDRIYIAGSWQNGAISAQELQASGFRAPGDVYFSGRITPAPYSVYADGAAYSRTAFPKALAGLTLVAAANVAAGVQTLQSVSKDIRTLGLEGATLEIATLGFASTIISVTATTILLATAPPMSAAGAQIQIFPWGNGDGSSTFNVPKMNNRSPVGRFAMGIGGADAVVDPATQVWTAKVGGKGGADAVALTVTQLPVFKPTVTISSVQGAHAHTYTQSNDSNTSTSGSGGSANRSSFTAATGAAQPAITSVGDISAIGGGASHTNMQPGRAGNFFCFMGDPTT